MDNTRSDRRDPDPEIPGLKRTKSQGPEMITRNSKKEFQDFERVNPEIPSLKTPDPGVPIKVLSPK